MKRCTKTMKPIEKIDDIEILNFGGGLYLKTKDPIRVKINEIIERINDLPKRKGKK